MQFRHVGRHSYDLRAMGLRRSDVVACMRVLGVGEDAAVQTLLQSSISGAEIEAHRRREPGDPEPRISAATTFMRRRFSS